MKLYIVRYKTWNWTFSGLIDQELFSVGENSEDAINRAKGSVADRDARDWSAEVIEQVLGYTILVKEG